MVPGAGFEPTRPCGQRILSPPRLPIPPSRQGFSLEQDTPLQSEGSRGDRPTQEMDRLIPANRVAVPVKAVRAMLLAAATRPGDGDLGWLCGPGRGSPTPWALLTRLPHRDRVGNRSGDCR